MLARLLQHLITMKIPFMGTMDAFPEVIQAARYYLGPKLDDVLRAEMEEQQQKRM
jgi:hypothetical protein